MAEPQPNVNLKWTNVGLAFSFILLDSVISGVFGLGVGGSLITAAVRCIVQLALVGTLLQKVFAAENPWAVAGIAVLLNLLGTFETVVNKSKRRHEHMVST
jgi:ABC-type iron transport system FetAB permease component